MQFRKCEVIIDFSSNKYLLPPDFQGADSVYVPENLACVKISKYILTYDSVTLDVI